MAADAKSLNELKKLRAQVNWENPYQREDFLYEFYHLIEHWEGQRPNFRDIFWPKEIDWLLEEGMSFKLNPEPFIDLMIETGYKDEPDVDKDGKPLWHRSTGVHGTQGYYPKWERITRKLFKIYDRFDVNYTDDGVTHFHVACEYGLYDVVQKFLELGQDHNLFENYYGESTLSLTVRLGHKDVALLLLKNGANPNSANEEGSTILHFLCDGYYDVKLLKMLFEICDESSQTLQVDAKDKFGRTPLQLAVARLLPNTVDVLLDRGADLASSVFPAESDFDKRYSWFEWKQLSDALLVVEHLEKRGYELDRSDALTIMHFFDKYKLFDQSSIWVKCSNHEEFESRLKNIEIRPSLSLYELFRMRSDEAAKLFTVADYYKLAGSGKLNELIYGYGKVCNLHLCEITLRRFCRRWALDSFMELTRYRLPIVCCDIIIRNLMNEHLFHICLAAEDQSHEDSKKILETNGGQCNNKRPARARKAPQRLQIVW